MCGTCGRFGRSDDGLRRFDGEGEWLFADDPLATPERLLCDFRVEVDRGGDHHQVVCVIEGVPHVVAHSGNAVFGGDFLSLLAILPVDEKAAFRLGAVPEPREMLLPEPGANYRGTHHCAPTPHRSRDRRLN